MDGKTYYLTTPIYYVNDKPHIGHAYTTILADVLARYHRTTGEKVFFLTGLDEHGQKVQQAAEKRGVPPQQHCDEMAPRFTELWERLEIKYDDFVRTTEPRHTKVVQDVLQKVHDKGDIYQDEYEGWYSVAEERFITEKEVESGEFRDVKKIKEKNYFFKMGQYQDRLIKYIEDHPEFIRPEHRRNEILGFLKQPLGDLCISRPKSRLSWGIELPFDKDYVTYVWFDALLNYVSIPGYLSEDKKFQGLWPADAHLIGKDILMTHAVYWPTMLFSLDIPLPKTILAHGWWLIGKSKMSKSLGNIVNPLDLIEEYGVDPVRYYLMSEMVMGMDASFTLDSFVKRFNSDLANDFGNLLNRVSGLIGKYFEGVVPKPDQYTDEDKEIIGLSERVQEYVRDSINKFEVHSATYGVLEFVGRTNAYLEKQAPWKVAKEDLNRAGTILYTATEALRLSAVLLDPVMPSRCRTVLDVLGAGDPESKDLQERRADLDWGRLKPGTKLKSHEPLFPRIEIEKS